MNEPDWNRPPYRYRIDPPSNGAWWVGLIVAALFAATAHLAGHPNELTWRDGVELASTVAMAVNAYLIRRP